MPEQPIPTLRASRHMNVSNILTISECEGMWQWAQMKLDSDDHGSKFVLNSTKTYYLSLETSYSCWAQPLGEIDRDVPSARAPDCGRWNHHA